MSRTRATKLARKRRSKATSPIGHNPGAQRDSSGRFQTGNTSSLKHGLRSRRALTASLLGQEALRATLAERHAEILQDLGGDETLSLTKRDLARRFVELTGVADSLLALLLRDGLISSKGRQRAALSSFLGVVDRLTRIAGVLGLERHAKKVPDLETFLAQRTRDQP